MHRTVYLKTTDTCNLNCHHCFTNGSQGRKIFWDHEKVSDWIFRLNETLSDQDSVHFELHGGEPFLAPLETLRSVVWEAKKLNPRFSFAAATNLVYKLTDEIRQFICHDLDNGISTSWDPSIRFANKKQFELWSENLKTMISDGVNVTLNISMSRDVLSLEIEPLLLWIKQLGIKDLAFERITEHGNAVDNRDHIPSNVEVDAWYVKLHEATVKLGARDWFYNVLLEDVYAKFEKHITNNGTFLRACEERLFTLNADGTIGGCPNAAPLIQYGHIEDTIDALNRSPGRLTVMAKEKMRHEGCLTCEVFQFCGSGCYQLKWEDNVCPSPKTLMRHLAGLPASYAVGQKPKRTIPIFEVR